MGQPGDRDHFARGVQRRRVVLAPSLGMQIIVLNANSPKNAGDLAILQQTMAVLRRAFPDATLTITVNDEISDLLPAGASYVGSLMRWVLRVDGQGEWRWRKPLVPFYALWLILAALAYRVAGLR